MSLKKCDTNFLDHILNIHYIRLYKNNPISHFALINIKNNQFVQ